MKAIICDGFGGPEVLKIGIRPLPVPNENEVVIKIMYSAINRAECL
jgi:NADPH:quinone reductase-like Zn-dependent oxidoreductase